MNKVRLIAELGSCHMGKLDRIKEAVDRCKESGIDALKLQLFPNEAPYVPTNIHLSQNMFQRAFEYGKSVGLPVSASVFDMDSLIFLQNLNPEFIKLSFSKKHYADISEEINWVESMHLKGIEAIVSCDVMSDHKISATATKLYCIPEYPVRYEISFDELFPRFDGFSDHTLGIRQTKRAIDAGAKLVEKHVKLGYEDETCPDSRFSVPIEVFGQLRKYRPTKA